MNAIHILRTYFGTIVLTGLVTTVCFISCTDSEFLDTIPDKALVVPQTLEDYQAILDRDQFMNGDQHTGVTPYLGEAGSNDYTPLTFLVNLFDNQDVNIFTWNSRIFERDGSSAGWNYGYRIIFYANSILDGLEVNASGFSETEQYKYIKGGALFHRAHALFQLSQIFAPHFDANQASSLQGLPLRLSSDINENLTRSTLKETYDQIIKDLKNSLTLLPASSNFNTRPRLPAAYALLARVFLVMHRYDEALLYADSCLRRENFLMDYNTVPFGEDIQFPFGDYRVNPEILFFSSMERNSAFLLRATSVNEELFDLYAVDDLRRNIYFKPEDWGGVGFYGSYTGYFEYFTGLATDEQYLIKAECLARKGDLNSALSVLNQFKQKRYDQTSFAPFNADGVEEVLQEILLERRKELLYRGLRWSDLRRLNMEGAEIKLQRTFKDKTYTLLPNDPKYVYPIPPEVIAFNPDMPQNPR